VPTILGEKTGKGGKVRFWTPYGVTSAGGALCIIRMDAKDGLRLRRQTIKRFSGYQGIVLN
jgi:hypothetical protein